MPRSIGCFCEHPSNGPGPFVGQHPSPVVCMSQSVHDVLFLLAPTLISLKLAQSFSGYFDIIIEILARIGDVLPGLKSFWHLFSQDTTLSQAMTVAYLEIMEICWTVKEAFRKMKKSSLSSSYAFLSTFSIN